MQNFNKGILIMGITLMSLAPSLSTASTLNEKEVIETVGVFIRGLQICHQHEWRNLTLNLEYEAEFDKMSADTLAVKAHVKTFLENYSHPDDFWEIMNTKLIRSIVKTFPEIITLSSTFSLMPDRTLGFPRKSIVSYKRDSETLKESFSFTKLNYLICQETFCSLDLKVSWDMIDNPNPLSDYPDYQWIDGAMDAFFKEHPISFSKWKELKPKLLNSLLERFPTLTSIDIEVKVVD